jgi:hypothetical protein
MLLKKKFSRISISRLVVVSGMNSAYGLEMMPSLNLAAPYPVSRTSMWTMRF